MAKTKIKAKSKVLKTIVTPDGVAAFAYLREPDEKFQPTHRIQVFFDAKEDKVKKFFKLLKTLENKWRVEQGRKPKPAKALAGCIKRADAELAELVGVKVGAPYIKFDTKPRKDDSGEWIHVPVFGANGKPTRTFVYGTDLVTIETNIAGWITPQGLGIKCYLGAVQLLESRYEGGAQNAGKSFGVREDFLVDEDDDPDAPEIEDDETLEDEDEIDLDLDDDDESEEDESEEDDPAAGLV